ncbi:unnamed protein product [Lactuca saligna]|uniref:ArsA/GET3 Anion-transporting ATPase-like domain-containing protein n=1 Tax=Lactuca saligna TaxID=75948 RepID=A0AA36DVA4_LACSI|nr:unnamed protein product [Lactuca saligna]
MANYTLLCRIAKCGTRSFLFLHATGGCFTTISTKTLLKPLFQATRTFASDTNFVSLFDKMTVGNQRKYYMLGGKGGVGKTSCAASLAVNIHLDTPPPGLDEAIAILKDQMRAIDMIQKDPELGSLDVTEAPLVDVEIRGIPALQFMGDMRCSKFDDSAFEGTLFRSAIKYQLDTNPSWKTMN